MRLSDLTYYPRLWMQRLFPRDLERMREEDNRAIREQWTPEQIERMHHIDFDDPEIKDVLEEIRVWREQQEALEPRGVPRRSQRPG